MGPPPSVTFVKFVQGQSDSAFSKAESEFKESISAGIPVDFSKWPPATSNDLTRGTIGYEVSELDNDIGAAYLGGRETAFGRQLYFVINFQTQRNLSMRASDQSFLRAVVIPENNPGGLVMIGQTHADLRSLSVVTGRRADVFAYFVGVRAGYHRPFFRPGEKADGKAFPMYEVASYVRSVLPIDEVVSVSGWSSAGFLKRCFREIDSVTTAGEFDALFGHCGNLRQGWVASWIKGLVGK